MAVGWADKQNSQPVAFRLVCFLNNLNKKKKKKRFFLLAKARGGGGVSPAPPLFVITTL
jgi:hypothetical protein